VKIRKVTVEVLREGPRHNQLLSPLTHYLAICGDSPAARLMLPPNYEQANFERKLSELRYEVVSDDVDRLHSVLQETGTEIGTILGNIPGLAGTVSAQGDATDTLVHLQLVLSASELARLPFELSKVPAGGGAPPDEWLLLHRPICLTRRNRSVPASRRPWGRDPRILFVAGPDVEEAYDEHLGALRRVLAPWSTAPEQRGPKRSSEPWLTVLRNASLGDLEAAMRRRPAFVHVLAHGDDDFDDPYGRFGVNLADETVSGERLASAMTSIDETGEHLPTVVTMATCDSANEASPIPPDTSVAFSLHSRGVPLVIASQFPLSVDGSLPFVEVLYDDLMRGVHPFESLYRLRLKLHSNHSGFHHDWASVTVHESLSDGLDAELEEVRYWQSRRAHETALRRVELATDGTHPPVDVVTSGDPAIDALTSSVESAAARLPIDGAYEVEAIGLRAAGWKRLAEVEFRRGNYGRSARSLRRSLDEYQRAANALLGSRDEVVNKKVSLHWMLTQVLSTSLLFDGATDDGTGHDAHYWGDQQESWWTTSKLSAEIDRDTQTGDTRAWGHVSLIELSLLRLAAPRLDELERFATAATAFDNARQLVTMMGKSAEQTQNTYRQIERYINWWGSPEFSEKMAPYRIGVSRDWTAKGGLLDTARRVVAILGDGELSTVPHPDGPCDPPSGATAESGNGPGGSAAERGA
jgi:hypothetical protein